MKGIKSVIGVLLVLVMLGSVVSPVFAVNVEQKTSTCPSCSSGVVTIPKDLQIAELKGSSAYLKALQVFNSKNALKLREYLKNMNFRPLYDKAIVQIVKYKGISTEIVKIPLEGKNVGMLVYVRNRFGEATAIGVISGNGMDVFINSNNGKIEKKHIEIQGNALKCAVCTTVVGVICKIGLDRASVWGCARVCGLACADLIEDPPAYVVCTWLRIYLSKSDGHYREIWMPNWSSGYM